ncbi:MAG: peptidylprolyl isomerase [Fibrobacteres bacterium]|nr:peptidylprolyl isomerase [Fibrobacterota bacterium]
MNNLRSGTFVKWVMVIVVVTFVGTIFFAWGMDLDGGGGMGAQSTVAEIDGKKIPYKQFNDDLMNRYRSERRDEELPASRLEKMREDLFQQYIAQHILEQAIKSLKLTASTDELVAYFRSNPPPGLAENEYFMTNGVFDTLKYHQFLDSPEAYKVQGMAMLEKYHSEYTIPVNQLQVLMSYTPKVTDLETKIALRNRDEKASLEWVFVPAMSMQVAPEAVTEKEINEWYKANSDTFKTEGMAELEYVEFAKQPSIADEESIKREIDEIAVRLGAGESFTALAFEISEDGSAKDSGSLGFFGKGAMVKPFEDAAYALKPGQISAPIRTQFGWHIIQCVERNDKEDKINCRHILLKIQPSIETVDGLKEKADTLAERIKRGEKLQDIAAKDGLQYARTGVFKKGAPVPGFQGESRFVSGLSPFAFSSDKKADAFENEEAVYVFSSLKRSKSGVAPLEFVKDDIKSRLLAFKRMEAAKAKAEAVYSAVTSGATLKDAAARDSLVCIYGADSIASRESPLPMIGAATKAVHAAFALADGAVTKPLEAGNNGYAVVRKIAKAGISPDLNNQSAIAELRQQTQQQQQYYTYGIWFEMKREGMKITNNVDAFYYQ